MIEPTQNGIKILAVDDDHDLLRLIDIRLSANKYIVKTVDNAVEGLRQLSTFRPHVVVIDLRMPGMDGMAMFEEIQNRDPHLPVVVLTAHGTIPHAVNAIEKGVFSYLVKPFKSDVLLDCIKRATSQVCYEYSGDTANLESWREGIIGQSELIENVLNQSKMAASSEANILIQSETGTGKELFARALHKISPRADFPFIALNCAAIPENLIESELFGHSAGSFTDAKRTHVGIFQAAEGGTVFLDEVGDMPIRVQAKLLRVIEQKEVRPVGSTKTIPVNVRIIAATHRDLHNLVAIGEFREDLYFRLDVISLQIPPLRERKEDIPLLIKHFCKMLSRRDNKELCRFTPEAIEVLFGVHWPGNVRELFNVVEKCVVLSPTPLITRRLVTRTLRCKPDRLLNLSESRMVFERDYLVKLLNLTEGNIAMASRLADRNRSEFYNLLKRHGLEPANFRSTKNDH